MLLFFHIPKTAGISISSLISETSLIEILRKSILNELDKDKYLLPYPDFSYHVTPKDLSQIAQNYSIKLYYDLSFTVVRNPWGRTVSMYNFARQNDMFRFYKKKDLTFLQFCEFLFLNRNNDKMLPALSQTSWTHSVIEIDRILRFEQLNENWNKFVEDYKLKLPELPHLNASKKVDYKSYYDSHTKNLISQTFEEDIDTFKYVF